MKNIIRIISAIIIFIISTINVSAEETFRRVYNENLILATIDYSEGLYAVREKSSQRVGVIDTYGNIVIPCEYKSVGNFSDGLCPVSTPDGEVYLININNERIYKHYDMRIKYTKHGEYGIIVNSSKNTEQAMLINSRFENTVENELWVIENGLYWFFVDNIIAKKDIYNYKGENITAKLAKEGVEANSVFACGKYLGGICYENDKTYIKVFDINGSRIATAESTTGDIRNIRANSDFIVLNPAWSDGVIFNTNGKELYRQSYEDGRTYRLYDNCVVIARNGKTSALIGKEGNKVIDFGKWDNIYPTANPNVYLVGVGYNYGLADKNGDLVLPLNYSIRGIGEWEISKDNGKYVTLNDKNNQQHTINVFSMKEISHPVFVSNGAKYVASAKNTLNDNFEYITSNPSNDRYLLLDGVVSTSTTNLDLTVLNDNGGTKVKVDGEYLTFEKFPEIVNGRTLVPLRKIFEAIGAEVIWNGADQSITATKDNVAIKMQINNNTLIKNGQSTEMDVSPQLIDGFTMVPVRAISDCFNIIVDWNEYSHTVSLFTD